MAPVRTRGAKGRNAANQSQSAHRTLKHAATTAHVADFVDEKERSSLFNKRERSVWYLPRKPTLLYIYDVIARSQMLRFTKKWYIHVPSGHWRVLYGYFNATLATIDVYCCFISLAFCGAPYVGVFLWVVQLLFLVDLAVKLTSALPMPAGNLEFRPRAIALHHLRNGSLIIDVLCLLPLELFWFSCNKPFDLNTSCRSAYSEVVDWGVLNWQLTHLIRWALRLQNCDKFRSVTETSNDGPLQITKYLFLIFVVAHTTTCILFWASFSGDDFTPVCDHRTGNALPWTNVSLAIDRHNNFDPFNQILASNPFSATMPLSVGKPIVPESEEEAARLASDGFQQLYIFWLYAAFAALLGDPFGAKNTAARLCVVIFMLLGNVVFAAVLGEVILALQESTASRDQFAARMNSINETMRYKGVPNHLQRRVHRFYEFMWLVHGAAMNEADLNNPMEWLAELPSALRVDINTEQYKVMISSCVLFRNCEPALIMLLAQKLKPVIYMPDELVIKEGWLGTTMYFVQRGQARVIVGRGTEREKFVGSIVTGGFFGEVALTSAAGCRRAATVISTTLLMCLKLHRHILDEVAVDFPRLMMNLRQTAINRRRQLGEEVRLVSDTTVRAVLTHSFTSRLAKRATQTKEAAGAPAGACAPAGHAPSGLGLCSRITRPLQQKDAHKEAWRRPINEHRAHGGGVAGIMRLFQVTPAPVTPRQDDPHGDEAADLPRPGEETKVMTGGHTRSALGAMTSDSSSTPRQERAAIMLQKHYRGFTARTSTRSLNMFPSRTAAEMVDQAMPTVLFEQHVATDVGVTQVAGISAKELRDLRSHQVQLGARMEHITEHVAQLHSKVDQVLEAMLSWNGPGPGDLRRQVSGVAPRQMSGNLSGGLSNTMMLEDC